MEFVQTLLLGFARALRGLYAGRAAARAAPACARGAKRLGGIAALAAVDVLAGYTGVALALNYATAFGPWCWGHPGGDAAASARRAGAEGKRGAKAYLCGWALARAAGCGIIGFSRAVQAFDRRRALCRQAAACPGKEEKKMKLTLQWFGFSSPQMHAALDIRTKGVCGRAGGYTPGGRPGRAG